MSKTKIAKRKSIPTFSEKEFQSRLARYFTQNQTENYPLKDMKVLAGNFLYDFPQYKDLYSQDQIETLFTYQQNQ